MCVIRLHMNILCKSMSLWAIHLHLFGNCSFFGDALYPGAMVSRTLRVYLHIPKLCLKRPVGMIQGDRPFFPKLSRWSMYWNCSLHPKSHPSKWHDFLTTEVEDSHTVSEEGTYNRNTTHTCTLAPKRKLKGSFILANKAPLSLPHTSTRPLGSLQWQS